MHPEPDRLLRIPLFAGLSDADRARIASWFDIEDFAAGATLARRGTSGYSFFAVDEGRVRVERNGSTIKRLGPGDVFGEMSLYSPDGRRNADVIADTEVTLLSMFGTHFREMQQQMPDVAGRLEHLVHEREDAPPAPGDGA
jgi:CRP-like cAMP-binding protein